MSFRLMLGLFLCLCLTLAPVADIGAGDGGQVRLLVCHLEFPPYYFTNSLGEPDGFLLRKTDAVLRAAGIEPVYQSMPAKRILELLHSKDPVCSIGWFKTPHRESFAKFSKPIYRNQPLCALALKENVFKLEGRDSLAQILADETIVLGVLEGYSLGADVDDLIARARPGMKRVNGDYPQLVRMLAMERFTCILVAPEEVESLLQMTRLDRDLFTCKGLVDVPTGNARHLMYSMGVPDRIVARIDELLAAMDENQ
ncbi:extracellular solute-binding protein family 3 [Pseudodesulfovibrio aespoeensis Aspo-2]|uniref:Extracellular solute-binding protein family 3 n=2 Tax=Desulfovibrionaceae TaxID=194924 RepID=E6VSR7_PSEA9|nr:extracellular solute-binding protein family 3 [Pseudodesulfovibrio aespoeensis Aspo-2]